MSTSTTTAPASGTAHDDSAAAESTGVLWGYMASFDSSAAITEAAKRVRDEGYRWWDTHTPFPVHGLDKAMGIKPTILPILVFFGGITGTTLGVILQWFTNASSFDMWTGFWVRGYEFLISGKPMWSWPAFVPVIFELTILLSALGTVGWMLLLNGLPQFYHPTLKHPNFARVTNDRFYVVIEARDPRFSASKTKAFLESLNPIEIDSLEP